MFIINKAIKITESNKKVEFDLGFLPEGEYEMQLTIQSDSKLTEKIDFGVCSSSINIPSDLTFGRYEIYCEDVT